MFPRFLWKIVWGPPSNISFTCLIWNIISFILPPNENDCVSLEHRYDIFRHYFGNHGNAAGWITYGFVKKRRSTFCSVFKQTKMSHLGHRKPASIYWKAEFLGGKNRGQRWPLKHVERIFVHKNVRRGNSKHLVSTGRRYVSRSEGYLLMFCTRLLKNPLSAAELISIFVNLGAANWHQWTSLKLIFFLIHDVETSGPWLFFVIFDQKVPILVFFIPIGHVAREVIYLLRRLKRAS